MNFVARDVLRSRSIQDAVRRVSVTDQCQGASFNIYDIGGRRMGNVETAPGGSVGQPKTAGAYSYTEIGADVFFHANRYKLLRANATYRPSSEHREARAAEILKTMEVLSGKDLLYVLGDQADQAYPIYGGPKTLTTTLFDFPKGVVSVWARVNPKSNPQTMMFNFNFSQF